MSQVEHTSSRAASRHIARAAALLSRAEHHLNAARSAASNRFEREQLHRLTRDLRSIGSPLASISPPLEIIVNKMRRHDGVTRSRCRLASDPASEGR
jgi:hypothetical protein